MDADASQLPLSGFLSGPVQNAYPPPAASLLAAGGQAGEPSLGIESSVR
jgi:hypothetical protein